MTSRSTTFMKRAARLPLAEKSRLIIQELDGETLVYDLERNEAHCLNHTAALVWKYCDGKTTVSQATGLLRAELGTPVDADLVWLGVRQLTRFHLVKGRPQTLGRSVSRRDLVLKYAPLALTLPVILSISAPTPAQMVSGCIPNGGACGIGSICCSGPGSCCGVPQVCQAFGC